MKLGQVGGMSLVVNTCDHEPVVLGDLTHHEGSDDTSTVDATFNHTEHITEATQ